MKELTLISFLLTLSYAQGQNYIRTADSCFNAKNYVCSALHYELYLDKSDPESNGIAYKAAVAWSLAEEKEKAFAALNRYIKNNALNRLTFFSEQLVKQKNFDFLKDDPRWTAMITSIQQAEAAVAEQERIALEAAQAKARSFEAALDVRAQLNSLPSGEDIYPRLKNGLHYKAPDPYLTNQGITLYIRVDQAQVPFYVHLPDHYNPAVPSPALVVLHGGVKGNKSYGPPEMMAATFRMTSEHIPEYAQNYITIYPRGINTLNWMNTKRGFEMVNQIVIHLKAFLNIDDNRVELLGHSNGATGVFTYLVKSPTLYAGFYGMNTRPKVYIGGTFLQNGLTRHFYNFATDQDYYYPPQAVKTIDSLAHSLGVRWHTELNKGFPQWFPVMKESKGPLAKLFADMATRVRNPYPEALYFETDDVTYGTSDWLTVTGLDTLNQKAAWQLNPNFKIESWLDNVDFTKLIHRPEMAFEYPRQSGAIKAERNGNTIRIVTSNVTSFSIKLNREMVDYSHPIIVYLNGKKVYSRKIKADEPFTLTQFKSALDRKVIWENELHFVSKD